ncbi:MAG: MFS transporter [SAR202 cluster bacterium]|nr:MFS transporter [SAR202 cluster bacterium]MDP6800405.1 MFS transporter [SAR202 cluster bacterium]
MSNAPIDRPPVDQEEAPVPEGGIAGYLATAKRFTVNAKLFLGYSLLSQLGAGIWTVMFNLYLLRLGFGTSFVGLFIMVDMLFHGLVAFPAGLLADKIGRRKAFFIATCISLGARGTLLFVHDSKEMLLILAAISGVGEAFHGVAGPPFIMENSEPKERPLLFSPNAMFLMVSRGVGSALPLVWAISLGVPDLDVDSARWVLVASLPLTLAGLAPLAFMTEKRVELVESFLDLFALKNVVNFDAIAKLTVASLVVGTGFGLATRFFNVFFDLGLGATDRQISAIFAVGAVGGATAIVFSGMLVQRWGKVRSIVVTQIVSVPFLVLMVAAPMVVTGLPLVVAFFLLRDAFYSLSMPIRNQISMELTVAKERGTTAGMTHMAFDLGGAFGAGIAGVLIGVEAAKVDIGVDVAEFLPAFVVAAALVVIAAAMYHVFFQGWESRLRRAAATPETAD